MKKASIPLILGRFTYLVGLMLIASNIIPLVRRTSTRLGKFVPVFLDSTATATTIFIGFILIVVARGLIRRKRRAWWIILILLFINLISTLFKFHIHAVTSIFSLSLILILIYFRNEFYAISDSLTRLAPLYAFLSSFIVVNILGILLIVLKHKAQILFNPSFSDIILEVLAGLVGVSGPITFASSHTATAVSTTLATLGFGTIVFPLLFFFRRVNPISKISSDEVNNIKQLIKRNNDQDSLGYFATRKDKSVMWSNNKKAGIAYRVQNGVMLASGDPFGEYSLWPEVIQNFLECARIHAWTPAVMGASDLGGEVWVANADLQAIDIGDEAIIDVEKFTLEGRPMANVRQMFNRIKRKGYETQTNKFVEFPIEIQNELRHLAKKWRYGHSERGFSMSMDRFGESEDSDCVISIVKLEGEIKGFLYFVPWMQNRLSLDRMQRDRNSDPGINEYLIVSTTQWAKDNNYTHISLNFAAFRSLFERADKINAGVRLRTTRNLIRFFSNWFQVESLYRFNAKFQPEWCTRYVLYPKSTELFQVGWAALRAEKFIQGFRTRKINP